MAEKSILILSPFFSPNIGGVESYLDDLCRYLIKQNRKVYVVTYQPLTTRARGLRFEKKGDLEIRRIAWFGHNLFHRLEPYPLLEFLYLTPWLFIHTLIFLIKNSSKIEVMHAQGLNAAFITRYLAPLFKKKAVVSTCAVYHFKKNSLIARIIQRIFLSFHKILSLGEFSRQELIGIGLPENRIKAYALWVNEEIYKPQDKEKSKSEIGLKDKFVVLFVGRFIEIKGVSLLIDIAKQVDTKINFCFIGDNGPLLDALEKAAAVRENIILIKNIRGHQLVPYYQAADILVVPSQYDEAFGKVIIEALFCGTPVIASNRGAIPYILDSSVGVVVEPTLENIKKQIEYFYHNPEALSQLSKNCRPYAEKFFSEKNAEMISKAYD